MKRAEFELKVMTEWVLGGSEPESGSTSVGGLAHRLEMLPEASKARVPHMRSPRLADPQQAKDFRKRLVKPDKK